MQAVILAAGLGSRIRGYHDLPKGFIRVGEDPIIIESINTLKQYGINDILIVTGYRSDFYENLAEDVSGITTVFNSDYNHSGSLYSLYCAKDWAKEDFLLLESDLLYEARAVDIILKAEQPTVILLSGPTQSSDEIYVEADHHRLVNMSKKIDILNANHVFGEFVGINKLSLQDFQQLISIVENDTTLLNSGHYEEHGLVALTKQRSVYCLKVPDLSALMV